MPETAVDLFAVMLIIGVAKLPLWYYTVLRFIACGYFIWAAIFANNNQRYRLALVFGMFAVLFNPIVKFHLSKDVWSGMDIATAAFVFLTRRLIRAPEAKGD